MGSSEWYPAKDHFEQIAAHEAGHLFGLRDRYIKVTKGGETVTVAEKRWRGNIMAWPGGVVDERNIDLIVKKGGKYSEHVHYVDLTPKGWQKHLEQIKRHIAKAEAALDRSTKQTKRTFEGENGP
jgi:rubrerythrin